MRRTRRWIITIGLVMWVSLAQAQAQAQAQAPDSASRPAWEEFWATTVQGRLKVRVYPSSRPSTHPALIIVLHGDSPFAPPSYQYRFARQAAAQSDGAVVAAILRPGYTDGESQSDGTRGTTNGDNYTPEVVDAVNQAITQLRDKYKPRHVVVVGHSGGAAIGADLLGRHPEAGDVALLVACPCDVTAWRRHMKVLQGSSIWDVPVSSLSPMDLVRTVSLSTRVWMVVGLEDRTAPPVFTSEYADALRNRGVRVDVIELPGRGHDILLERTVFETLHSILTQLNGTAAEQGKAGKTAGDTHQ